MKTNRDKNTEHDKKELLRVRPKGSAYDFKPLEDVVRQWITGSK
jgi:hypothetical protein